MYYYLFEPPEGPKDFERTSQIKEYLSNLGIAGEMNTPQPGKTVEDLVELAVAKRYSTIIAVGGMELINRTAQAILEHDLVFGIIPNNEHPDITRLIGVSDWKSAANQLKRRRFQLVQMGNINGQYSFLTPANIEIPSSGFVEVKSTDINFIASGPCSVSITPTPGGENKLSHMSLEISSGGETEKIGLLKRLFNKVDTRNYNTKLSFPSLSLKTDTARTVTVAGKQLCTTPINCSPHGKSLKLIVGKSA